jgi:transcriptional regulator with XRE-family HTH domain
VPEETFGARLKRPRERAGLSQEQLALRAGLNRYSVIKWERDEHEPMWSSVLALARALGCAVADFDGTKAPPADVRPARKGRPRKAQPPAQSPAPGQAGQGQPRGQKRKGRTKKE